MEIIKLKRNTRKQPLAFLQRVFALLLFPVERTVTSIVCGRVAIIEQKDGGSVHRCQSSRASVFIEFEYNHAHEMLSSGNNKLEQNTKTINRYLCCQLQLLLCVCVVYTYDFKNWFYERSKNATLIRFVSGKQWKQNKNNVSVARRFDRGSVEERNLKKRTNRRCTINIVAALLYKLL